MKAWKKGAIIGALYGLFSPIIGMAFGPGEVYPGPFSKVILVIVVLGLYTMAFIHGTLFCKRTPDGLAYQCSSIIFEPLITAAIFSILGAFLAVIVPKVFNSKSEVRA